MALPQLSLSFLPQWLVFWVTLHMLSSPSLQLFEPGPEFQQQWHQSLAPHMSPNKKISVSQMEY